MTYFQGGDPNLHPAEFDAALKRTHLGQAHIAGTGPKGEVCHNCRFFGLMDRGKIVNPGYYSKSDEVPHSLKTARCHAPMTNKSKRRFPYDALACRLFEPTDNPFPIRNPEAK